MSLYQTISGLPLEVESYAVKGLTRDVSTGFTRRTTVVRLRGGGHEGVGEDVTYDGDDQGRLQEAGPVQPLAGSWTFDSFSNLLGELDLFPEPPGHEVYRNYRRWAFESAALDLALRQAGQSLAGIIGREPRPVTFVVSMRLGEPASIAPVRRWLVLYPALRFKLDPTSSWSDELVAELAATGAVDSVDLKGFYKGTVVDQQADTALYARVAEGLPEAWIEDPELTEETDRVLEPHRDRFTWDAPIHSPADIEALPFPPRTINVKPSRFGPVSTLFETYEFCAGLGIGLYGGGQFELGPGRGQLQYLASIFHPDGPNDIAPNGYNDPEPVAGLPTSPLEPAGDSIGFRWLDYSGTTR
jgi:L-alanine-DL-glutamate epimerase-like enolase superfamily enzyme